METNPMQSAHELCGCVGRNVSGADCKSGLKDGKILKRNWFFPCIGAGTTTVRWTARFRSIPGGEQRAGPAKLQGSIAVADVRYRRRAPRPYNLRCRSVTVRVIRTILNGPIRSLYISRGAGMILPSKHFPPRSSRKRATMPCR